MDQNEAENVFTEEETSSEAAISLISKPILSAQSSIDENIISLE
jgi:hypothetical protein